MPTLPSSVSIALSTLRIIAGCSTLAIWWGGIVQNGLVLCSPDMVIHVFGLRCGGKDFLPFFFLKYSNTLLCYKLKPTLLSSYESLVDWQSYVSLEIPGRTKQRVRFSDKLTGLFFSFLFEWSDGFSFPISVQRPLPLGTTVGALYRDAFHRGFNFNQTLLFFLSLFAPLVNTDALCSMRSSMADSAPLPCSCIQSKTQIKRRERMWQFRFNLYSVFICMLII